MSKVRSGHCRLTQTFGPFVKCHILPVSLTRPEVRGAILFQHGSGRRAQKRRTSWYDPQIVTAQGEKILADLDDWAIKLLRKRRLIWSGFGPAIEVKPDTVFDRASGNFADYGTRTVDVEDATRLRRFFLSLLWRASVSKLPEMAEVSLDPLVEQSIADFLLEISKPPIDFFPCWLIQHHQIGFRHNHTPIKRTKQLPELDGFAGGSVEIYRFYFDGLVAHFHDLSTATRELVVSNELTVGYSERLTLTCVPWAKSAQLENLRNIARESLW